MKKTKKRARSRGSRSSGLEALTTALTALLRTPCNNGCAAWGNTSADISDWLDSQRLPYEGPVLHSTDCLFQRLHAQGFHVPYADMLEALDMLAHQGVAAEFEPERIDALVIPVLELLAEPCDRLGCSSGHTFECVSDRLCACGHVATKNEITKALQTLQQFGLAQH